MRGADWALREVGANFVGHDGAREERGVGAGEAGQFTVTGDTVNLAARLETASRVGHILVGETTYQLTRNVFRYTALPPITVKGKQEPVQTYEVVDIRDATQRRVAVLARDADAVGFRGDGRRFCGGGRRQRRMTELS